MLIKYNKIIYLFLSILSIFHLYIFCNLSSNEKSLSSNVHYLKDLFFIVCMEFTQFIILKVLLS